MEALQTAEFTHSVQGPVTDIYSIQRNKYFELKNLWGARVPLNSNYLLAIFPCMFNGSDSWGCSIADGLKDSSRCNGLLDM